MEEAQLWEKARASRRTGEESSQMPTVPFSRSPQFRLPFKEGLTLAPKEHVSCKRKKLMFGSRGKEQLFSCRCFELVKEGIKVR